MAYTEVELRTRIRTLEDGLIQVARGVTFADRGVTYNSAQELQERIGYFNELLRNLLGSRSRSRQSLGVTVKGF